MCCLPPCCCPPAGQSIGTYAATQMPGVLRDYEAQGIDDFFKNICVELGCKDRQEQGKPTLLGITHVATVRSLRQAFPDAAEDCISESVAGIITAIGEACASFGNDPVFLNKMLTGIAPHIGKLLSCLFGAERATEIQIGFYRYSGKMTLNFATCIAPLLMPILQAMCNGASSNLLGGCCPTNGGDNNTGADGTDIFGKDAPPHDPVIPRTGTRPETTGNYGD